MGTKKLTDLQIIELFIVKCGEDWTRSFMAEIIRVKTEDREDIIRGTVVINEGKVWCVAESGSEEELGNYLDDICSMKLDYGLHEKAGISLQIAGEIFFLN